MDTDSVTSSDHQRVNSDGAAWRMCRAPGRCSFRARVLVNSLSDSDTIRWPRLARSR